jgi:hypothetical protein
MVINRQVSRAMADQLDRVNTIENNPMQRLVDQLVAANKRIRELEEEVRKFRAGQQPVSDVPRDAVVYQGIPCYTLSQAARKVGVSYWKAYRIVAEGYWKHEINDSGHFMIHADQPLTIPPRKQKSRRKD